MTSRRAWSDGLPPEHLGARRVVFPSRWRGVGPHRVAVRGSSMEPTLSDGDVVLAVPGARVRAGRVALVRWPARPAQLSVKRLASASGDGRWWYAVGDRPAASTDSRTLGPARAVGPVLWRLWPRPGPLRVRP